MPSITLPIILCWLAAMTIISHLSLAILAEDLVNNNNEDLELKTILRFPRHRHLREDDWTEFAHLVPKLKRWEKENNTIEHDPVNMEEKRVKVIDASKLGFTVTTAGFELVDLHPRILPYLRTIKKQGLSGTRVGPTTAGNSFLFFGGGTAETVEDKLAHNLQGSDSFSLGGDSFHYAFRCTGFVIRKGGPEGSKIEGVGFDNVAQRVHIDQDIQGEPLLSLGLTWVFKLPYIHLLNIWSPLHDVRLRPLALVDRRTMDLERDVVRYRANTTQNAGGKFGSFRSDRLMSLYSDEHKWYWFPNVRFGQAVAFDTSSVPHSSFTLPGEEILSQLRNELAELSAQSSLSKERFESICSSTAIPPLPEISRISIDMDAFIGAAAAFKRRACVGRATEEEFAEMLEYISRSSLEIRCVTMIIPRQVLYIISATSAVTIAALFISRSVIKARSQ